MDLQSIERSYFFEDPAFGLFFITVFADPCLEEPERYHVVFALGIHLPEPVAERYFQEALDRFLDDYADVPDRICNCPA